MRLITLRRRIDEVCWLDSIDGRVLEFELMTGTDVVDELVTGTGVIGSKLVVLG
jgi:hypothetical protein